MVETFMKSIRKTKELKLKDSLKVVYEINTKNKRVGIERFSKSKFLVYQLAKIRIMPLYYDFLGRYTDRIISKFWTHSIVYREFSIGLNAEIDNINRDTKILCTKWKFRLK